MFCRAAPILSKCVSLGCWRTLLLLLLLWLLDFTSPCYSNTLHRVVPSTDRVNVEIWFPRRRVEWEIVVGRWPRWPVDPIQTIPRDNRWSGGWSSGVSAIQCCARVAGWPPTGVGQSTRGLVKWPARPWYCTHPRRPPRDCVVRAIRHSHWHPPTVHRLEFPVIGRCNN
eukprot:scaffold3823_cov195-Amphora_coffeaeformis.AAC.6